MKRLFAVLLLLCLLLTLSSCREEPETYPTSYSLKPQSFSSFEEFEASDWTVVPLYVPVTLPEGCALIDISTTINPVITVQYSIDPPEEMLENHTGYIREWLSTFTYSTSLYSFFYEDVEQAFQENYVQKGYTPVEYDGQTYYRWDEHAGKDPQEQVIGYELAFWEGNYLVTIHLPAIDTFENMMTYAEVKKVEIQ